MKEKLHWLAMHGFIRGVAAIGVRRGDLQARLIADPTVAADPVPYYDQLRALGPLVKGRVNYVTTDYALAHELLRSDDFRVVNMGSNLPAPLRWLERRTREDFLHPLREPSLLAVEPPDHTRYRKTVSAVFTSRAVAALRDRVEQTAANLLGQLSGQSAVVDIVGRYCSQLPVAIIIDILGCPSETVRWCCSSVSWAHRAWTSDCRGGSTRACRKGSPDSTSGSPVTCGNCAVPQATI